MSKEQHLGLNKFINIYRLIAPLFLCGMVSGPPNAFVIMVVLIYLIPQLLIWFVPVDCFVMGCNGRMQVSAERLSFWAVHYQYKCDRCDAERQAKIFNPNIEVTAEYS
jgi:hypothetical protein